MIDYSFFNAGIVAKRFAQSKDRKAISKPMCGTINVRFEPQNIGPALYDSLNEKISHEIIQSGYAYIVTTVLKGKICIRISPSTATRKRRMFSIRLKN